MKLSGFGKPSFPSGRSVGIAAGALVLVAALSAAFVLGRQTALAPSRSAAGSTSGSTAGPVPGGTYADGLQAGHLAGLADGRAQQVGAELPASQRADVVAQFRAGYRAGADDVFSGYDGGWLLAHRYVIVLGPGLNGEAYRITHREDLP
jgi:hypothetical protein